MKAVRSHSAPSGRAARLLRYGLTPRDAVRLEATLDCLEDLRGAVLKGVAEEVPASDVAEVSFDNVVAGIRRLVGEQG